MVETMLRHEDGGTPMWLELVADYRCNQACVGCYSAGEGRPSMQTREALEALRRGRRDGARFLWLGGGEPTLRPDLRGLVVAARSLGYERVKLQTNGMRLAYAEYARALVDAGVTEVALSLKGPDAAAHDALTRTERAFALLIEGAKNARAAGADLEGDVLVYAHTVASLPDTVALLADLGARRVRVWNYTHVGGDGSASPAVDEPRLSAVAAAVAESTRRSGVDVVALHVPACVLDASVRERAAFHAADLRMRVVNPGGHAFMLESSPMEGGHFVSACASCARRARCSGLRAAYVARHGDGEIRALEA
jgi:MoaA/NifB/PqqE/SkfB family radical SAM enzyme